MYQGRVEDLVAKEVFPSRITPAGGLFSWGRPQLSSVRLVAGWVEFLTAFLILPLIGIFADAANALPVTTALILGFSILLLSMTRSFHWRDLLPVDVLSEWRVLVAVSAGFAALSLGITTIFFPGHLFLVAGNVQLMLIAFPVLTALPIEIVYRALFFRRFGYLFRNEFLAIFVGMLATGLIYTMITESVASFCFGAILGAVLGWTYLRTGQFLLNVALHWVAALCVWIIGPGLSVF